MRSSGNRAPKWCTGYIYINVCYEKVRAGQEVYTHVYSHLWLSVDDPNTNSQCVCVMSLCVSERESYRDRDREYLLYIFGSAKKPFYLLNSKTSLVLMVVQIS